MIKSLTYKTTSLILVIMLLVHNANTLAIMINFAVNQEFISKTLCVQKDDQQGCYGKCQLRKELAENEDTTNDKIPAQETKHMMLDVYFVSNINIIEPCAKPTSTEKNKPYYNVIAFTNNILPVDTPPPNFS
ncbi:MAG: hypothetical protein ACK5MD_04510 [Flavobacteriales bacterium]